MGILEGRRALVTGGGSGIGLATVRRLRAEGASVAVVDLNADAARSASGEDGIWVQADVTDARQVDEAFKVVTAGLGGLDLVHLNAGVLTGEGDITKLTDEAYHRIVSVNVDGVVFGLRAAARLMSGGSIVATASLAGLTAMDLDPIYALTKHAVVGLVRSVAAQLSERGITVNAVCPGIVETTLVGEDGLKALKDAKFPLISPDDVADTIVAVLQSGQTAQAWFIQPGRESQPYRFGGVPGPRTPGDEGKVPPAKF